MKAVKTFAITLAIIIAMGGAILVGKSLMNNEADTSVASTKVSTTKNTKNTKTTKKKANPIKKAIVSEALNTYVDKQGGTAKEIMDSMSEEDKDTVTEIIAQNFTASTISDLDSYISDDDPEGLMKYAQDNLTEEEVAELEEIMKKYTK